MLRSIGPSPPPLIKQAAAPYDRQTCLTCCARAGDEPWRSNFGSVMSGANPKVGFGLSCVQVANT